MGFFEFLGGMKDSLERRQAQQEAKINAQYHGYSTSAHYMSDSELKSEFKNTDNPLKKKAMYDEYNRRHN